MCVVGLVLLNTMRYDVDKEAMCVNKIETLKQWIAESNRIVAFTGAGVSTESGIKDFRSKDGLYNEPWGTNLPNSTEICKLVHRRGIN